jgi:acyl carrier protein
MGGAASRDEELERIRARVGEVLSDAFGSGPPGPDDDLAALGIDSMSRLDLLARLEREFGIELTEDLIPEFRTMNRIARIVRGALALSAARPTGR